MPVADGSTVWRHLSEHTGTKGCSYNWNVGISENLLVYEAECFPFNAQENIYEYQYYGSTNSEDTGNWSLDKWHPTVAM